MTNRLEQRLAALEDLVRQQLKGQTGLCVQGQLCTYATHGADFIQQKWYRCETCGLVGDLGCCEICAQTCHKGHKLVFQGVYPTCACDCGAGEGSGQCRCMGPLLGMKSTSLIGIEKEEGIISSLTRKYRGNLHDRKQVIVTAREENVPDCEPKWVLDLDNPDTHYASRDWPGPWFCLDFGDRRVTVSRYWVRSYGKGDGHLKSWVLQGSTDGTAWVQMDSVCESGEMNRMYGRIERVVTGARGPFRYVRLFMTEQNHQGWWFLNCSGIELFGTLYERSK